MKNNSSVFSDNLRWLKKEDDANRALERLFSDNLAEDFLQSNDTFSPVDCFEYYLSFCKGELSAKGYLDFCRGVISRHTVLTEDNQIAEEIKTVSYLKSGVSDKAFDIFSKKFGGLAVSYGNDFRSVCEDVYYDRTDSAILPFESSSEGLLMSFRHLTLKYELRCSAVCTVSQNDEESLTLALMTGREFRSDSPYYELYVPQVENEKIAFLISLVSESNGVVLRITTIPLSDKLSEVHLKVTIPKSDLSAFKYAVDGIYPANMLIGHFINC